jgi:hypothetical protein
MASSPHTETGWNELFRTLEDYLKCFVAQHWPLQLDGSGSDVYLSLHRLYGAFPVAADILLLDTAGIDSPHKQERYATAIRYDFSKPNTADLRFHGVVPLTEAHAHALLIEEILGFDVQSSESLEALKDLRLTCIWKAPLCTHIVPYDPRGRVMEYCGALARQLSYSSSQLREIFSPKVDYNAKYNLESDPLLTDEQLLQADEINRHFVKFSDGMPETLSERHASVAAVQLIPQVPEDLKRTFRRAKRLYVYGHLEYDFFTASLHYAQLALDAALHARWSASLPTSVQLTLQKKKKVEKQETMASPSHTKIRNFCKINDWRVAAVHVDGQPFPFAVSMVIADLTAKGLLSQWQQKMILEVDVEIRNSLTHLEFAPIHGPSPDALELASETINALFDSLPLPEKRVLP